MTRFEGCGINALRRLNRKILGISAFYHDSAAAIILNGRVVAAAQEERFTREKHTALFPAKAIQFCLEETGFQLDELDAIVFYDKPFLKFERLLETYYAFVPMGLSSFLRAIPVWLSEKLFLKRRILEGLKQVGPYDRSQVKLLFTEHHLAHAASAFYLSPFERTAILTIDGVGEWATASIGIGEGRSIIVKKEMHFPHSVGLLYSAFTYYLGFKVNSGEYKLMGLAPYGQKDSEQYRQYFEIITSKLVDIKSDGSIWLNQHYFDYATGLRMTKNREWERLFGFPNRNAQEPLEQHHCDLALAIQNVTEEIILLMAAEAKRISNAENLVMAGGVALNCAANGRLLRENIFKHIYIQPAAGDAGGALGAALAAYHLYFEGDRTNDNDKDTLQGTYIGPSYSDKEITQMSRRMKAHYHQYESFGELVKFIAAKLAEGSIVGWFQGRMEFGPRALGNRSILADPRNPDMRQRLNRSIKMREDFRPFAPTVLAEDVTEYFDLTINSPYMLFTAPVIERRFKKPPESVSSLQAVNKVNIPLSDIPAVTHTDYTARVQTVSLEINSRYWELIEAFKRQTGCSVLVNTSFNQRGEPIACSPEDAYRCFMRTDLDYVVMNDFIFCKTDQPDWQNKERWNETFKPD